MTTENESCLLFVCYAARTCWQAEHGVCYGVFVPSALFKDADPLQLERCWTTLI